MSLRRFATSIAGLAGLAVLGSTGAARAASAPVELVADVCPGLCSGYYRDMPMIAGRTQLFFGSRVADPQLRLQVRSTDGTSSGTRLVTDIGAQPGFSSVFLWSVGDTLFAAGWEYLDASAFTSQWSLWRSEGTPATTRRVFPQGTASTSIRKAAFGASRGMLFDYDDVLWWVDASGSPPRKVANDQLKAAAEHGAYVYFTTLCDGCVPADRARLFRFSLEEAITEIAAPGELDDSTSLIATSVGVFAVPRNRKTVWFITGAGTPGLLGRWAADEEVDHMLVQGDRLLFSVHRAVPGDLGDANVWVSDGTAAGTRPLTHFAGEGRRALPLMAAEKSIYVRMFSRQTYPSPYPELPPSQLEASVWVIDGTTPKGARPLRAMDEAALSTSLRYFADGEWAHAFVEGEGIWSSDGTPGGTQRVVAPTYFIGRLGGRLGDYAFLDASAAPYGWELHKVHANDLRTASYNDVHVVEYYHAALDHYFMTADAQEIARLDSGATAGWARTGFGFIAYAPGSGPPGASPVCRFYGRPDAKLDSHFYSASPAECAEVEAKFGGQWQRESSEVFRVETPDPATGLCSVDLAPVFRAFNARIDANHRYSVHATDQKAMQQRGWIPEGSTSAGVAMCVLAPLRP